MNVNFTGIMGKDFLNYEAVAGNGTMLNWLQGDMALRKQDDGEQLDNARVMNQFLMSVERRAYRMAEIATGNADDALDIVQDAMLTLVKNYADKDEQDWGPLFHRILQNRIRDWYRRSSVRNKVLGWFGFAEKYDEAALEKTDPIQSAEDVQARTPEQVAKNDDTGRALDAALKNLPLRQQQAFLLRNWQGLSVKQTAEAMACAEGSVKTHYSRAVHQLRAVLEDYYES